MLSVQTPGCAGMERLGVPGRGGGGGGGGGGPGPQPPRQWHDHHDLNFRQNMASLNYRDVNRLCEMQLRARGVQYSDSLNCPPHIPLPDGERGPDRDLQIRVAYQQSELTQSGVQAPPNKSVCDVPDWAPPALPRKPSSSHKKDGFMQNMQKAVKYCTKIIGGGARGGEAVTTPEAEAAEALAVAAGAGLGTVAASTAVSAGTRAPCVMVPLRPPPAPAPSPDPPASPHMPPS